MENTQNEKKTEKVFLKGNLEEFRKALEAEIKEIKKNGQSTIVLSSGVKIPQKGKDYWYRFTTEYIPSLPADTPCKLKIGQAYFDVSVVSLDEQNIILSCKAPLPDAIDKAQLENGSTVLMEKLIQCIETNAEVDNPAGNRMLTPDGEVYMAQNIFTYDDLVLDSNNNENQRKAVETALSKDITYIWGPPGTGKTTVIGQIIDNLYSKNRSVLVVSHTNTAVDGAILKAIKSVNEKPVDADKENDVYPIIRLGVPVKNLPKEVTLDYHIKELGKDLYTKKKELETNESVIQSKINEKKIKLQKKTWLDESQLPSIKESLQRIETIDTDIKNAANTIEEYNLEGDRVKRDHPEYKQYVTLLKEYQTHKERYENLATRITNLEKMLPSLPGQISNAKDEIKKHQRYLDLTEKEAKLLPKAFLKTKINDISSNTNSLMIESDSLLRRKQAAFTEISAYENKGSLGKLFTNKNAIQKAQNELQVSETRIRQIEEEISGQKKLQEEYRKQLEEVILLQNQIKDISPIGTEASWKEKLKEAEEKLKQINNVLPSLRENLSKMQPELDRLEDAQSNAKVHFKAVTESARKARALQDRVDEWRKSFAQEKKELKALINKEQMLCSSFFTVEQELSFAECFDVLSDHYKMTSSELESYDSAAAVDEILTLEIEIADLRKSLNEINQKLQELEKQAILDAKIIGTTLAKSYLSQTLRERKFDTVILDEASMASIPALWCASYLAENSLIIVGDFLQLPPIVIADKDAVAKKWLGRDIFYHSGMQEMAKGKNHIPDNFVMLNEQFRMNADIADIANIYYNEYGGLRTSSPSEDRQKAEEEFYQWFPRKKTKASVHLIDTESLHAWVTSVPQGKGHSRLNFISAAISVNLAFNFIEKKLELLAPDAAEEEAPSVLIVAPYKPHVARINQLIDIEYNLRGFRKNLGHIKAGTVHSFQGSEADIVIFDLVIDEPHYKANLFLPDSFYEDGSLSKMFNVAITRARFKLFVVGNFAYCQKHAKDNAFGILLQRLLIKKKLKKEDAKELFPQITYSYQKNYLEEDAISGKRLVCLENDFFKYFLSDVISFKEKIIIYSPFMTENRLSQLLPYFMDAISQGKEIMVVTKDLSDRGKRELSIYMKCEKELKDIGVKVFHKKGMHEKIILVDDNITWIGSLNALSYSGETGEVMERRDNPALAADYAQKFNIDSLSSVAIKTNEGICPICGGEMIIRESDGSGIYWQCINKDYSRSPKEIYPEDGLFRCAKCGNEYRFEMKNEPRWICTENPKHYKKVRKGDLRLEKMVSLIPKTQLKQVLAFFEQSKSVKDKVNISDGSEDTSEQLSMF